MYWESLDSTAGISEVQISLDKDSTISESIQWFNVPNISSYIFTYLGLENGCKYYTKIRSFDYAGNVSDVLISDGFTIDTTPPEGCLVFDGIGFDNLFTQNDSTILSSWQSFSDSISGIAFYELALGLSGSDSNIIDWHNNSLDTFAVFQDISLTSGNTYFTKVRACDNVGNFSSEYISNGMMVDVDIPISGVVIDGLYSDMDWINRNDVFKASWSDFQDSSSGIKEFEYILTLLDTKK